MGQRNFQPKHKRVKTKEFNGNRRIENMYDHRWKEYRAKYLAVNTKCYSCGDAATVVDHLVPHKGCDKLFKKTDNHIPLCKPCHDKITGIFDMRYVVGASITPKIEWMQRNRSARGLSFKVKVMPSYP